MKWYNQNPRPDSHNLYYNVLSVLPASSTLKHMWGNKKKKGIMWNLGLWGNFQVYDYYYPFPQNS